MYTYASITVEILKYIIQKKKNQMSSVKHEKMKQYLNVMISCYSMTVEKNINCYYLHNPYNMIVKDIINSKDGNVTITAVFKKI